MLKLLKTIKLVHLSLIFITAISTSSFAERTSGASPIQCLLDVTVIASQNFQMPVTQYTSIKNDGYPMLLIGIKIDNAYTADSSKKNKNAPFILFKADWSAKRCIFIWTTYTE